MFNACLMKARSWQVIFPAVVVAFFIVINTFRFYALDRAPYGAHTDELASSLVMDCIASEGHDFRGARYPLFSELYFGTPKPPVYIYPGIAWGKAFGYSFASLRAYTAFFFIIALVGLFMLARLFWGTRFALWVLFFSCISPWVWLCSRLAYEPIFALTFLAWGLFFLFRSTRTRDMIIAGVLVSCSMYAYPPMRLQVPLMMAPLVYYRWRRGGLSLASAAFFAAALVIASVPMAAEILSGHLQSRFNEISIFAGGTRSWPELWSMFWSNYFKHFSPDFLFTTGSSDLAHTTRHNGILHWGDAIGLLLGAGFFLHWAWGKITRSEKGIGLDGIFIGFLVINLLIGIIPAALTDIGDLPHTLRTIGSWPFVVMLTAYFVWRASEKWSILTPVVVAVVMLFSVIFLKTYFTVYPQESKKVFWYWSMEQAQNARTEKDWLTFLLQHRKYDVQARYYLMQYKGDSCSSSKQKWDSLNEFLRLKGIQ